MSSLQILRQTFDRTPETAPESPYPKMSGSKSVQSRIFRAASIAFSSLAVIAFLLSALHMESKMNRQIEFCDEVAATFQDAYAVLRENSDYRGGFGVPGSPTYKACLELWPIQTL